MALENPALNERSFQRGIEEAGTEPRGMTAAGTYAITGLLFVIVVAAAASAGRRSKSSTWADGKRP